MTAHYTTPKPLREHYEARLLALLGQYRAAVAERAVRAVIIELAKVVEAAANRRCTPPLEEAPAALSAVREGLALGRYDAAAVARPEGSSRVEEILRQMDDEGEEWKRGGTA